MSSVSRSVGRPVSRSVLAGQLNNLASIIKSLFSLGEQGFAYDPNDLTEEKINWRKNQLLNTDDFTYGSSGKYTAVKEADGWALTAIAQDGVGYSLLGNQYPIGAASDSRGAGTVVRSIEVKKGTGVFRFGSVINSTSLFVDVAAMTAIDPPTGLPYTITDIGSDWYRIETFSYSTYFSSILLSNLIGWSTAKAASTLDTTTQVGAVIRVRKPSFAFVPFESTQSIPYQAITNFNTEFLRQFPLHTLYQDAAGTIPVTAAGQPVGLMQDKSGRNNHASQTVSASRPILQRNATTGAYYLAFDGADDFLQTNNIDFTATDKMSLFAGQKTNVPSSLGSLVETGSNYSSPTGGFSLYAPSGSTIVGSVPTVGGGISGGGGIFAFGPILVNNFTSTISLRADLSKALKNDQARLRVNGESKVPTASSTVVAGSKFSNVPVYIGRRGGGTLPFSGHIYSLIGIGRLTTDSETIALEKYIAKNTGVTLSV